MKNLIFSLLCLFLIGSFSGVSYGKTDETKNTKIVKDYSHIVKCAVIADEVVIKTPEANSNCLYKEPAGVSTHESIIIFYQVFKPDKNSRHLNYLNFKTDKNIMRTNYARNVRYWKTNKNKNLKLCSGYYNYSYTYRLC